MNKRKYLFILISIVVLSVIAVIVGIGQAFIVGGAVSIIHGVLMLNSKKYKTLIYSKFGKSVEFSFPDKEKFYKEHGVDINSKFDKYFNSDIIVGLIIIVQAAINNSTLAIKLSAVNAVLVGTGLFIMAIFLDILNQKIAKRSEDYSDFYLRIICISIFVMIPVMFFGLIWVLRKQY